MAIWESWVPAEKKGNPIVFFFFSVGQSDLGYPHFIDLIPLSWWSCLFFTNTASIFLFFFCSVCLCSIIFVYTTFNPCYKCLSLLIAGFSSMADSIQRSGSGDITRVLFCGPYWPASTNFTKEYLQSYPFIQASCSFLYLPCILDEQWNSGIHVNLADTSIFSLVWTKIAL